MGSSLTQGFNYVRLGSHTLSAASNTLTVSNIPSGYSFLFCYVSLRSTAGASSVGLILNADVAAHYYTQWQKTTGVNTTSNKSGANNAAALIDSIGNSWSLFNVTVNQIPSGTNKSIITNGGGIFPTADGILYITGSTWTQTAEVNEIQVCADVGTFDAGSQIIVYGVI